MAEDAQAASAFNMDNIRLYQILNLPRTDVTADEVKRGYRKAAARVHPDRNLGDTNATAKFQEVQYAYSVLSDPQKRSIYDSYGEQGLKMWESFASYTNTEDGGGGGGEVEGGGAASMPIASPQTIVTGICCVLGVLVGLVVSLCICLYLKLQNGMYHTAAPPLSIMLIPLWILNALGLILLYVFLGLARKRNAPTGSAALLLLELILTITCEILVVLRVDSVTPTLGYAAVFSPLYILTLIELGKAGLRMRKDVYENEKAEGKTLLPFNLFLAQLVFGCIARVAFLALLTLKLDGTLNSLWTLVLLPVWAYLGLSLSLACSTLVQGTPANERDQMMQVFARGRVFSAIASGVLLLFATLALDGALKTWLPVFFLFFLFGGCFFCCCCCAMCAMRMAPGPQGREVPPKDEESGAATDRSTATAAPSVGVPITASSTRTNTPSEDAPLLSAAGRGTGAPYRSSDELV